MKKLTYLLTALILFGSVVFISCDKVKELLELTIRDVEFTAQIKGSDLIFKADGFPFAGSMTLDPKTNEKLAEHLDNIRRIEVTEVKITVDSVLSASGLILNDALFSITDTVNDSTFTYSIPAAKPIAKGTLILIGGETPDYSTISDILSAMHVAEIGVDGHINQPGYLELTFTIKADVTVGVPLE